MSFRTEVANMLRDGDWEEAIDYLDRGIRAANSVIDKMQETLVKYEEVRGMILATVEELDAKGREQES